MNIPQPPQTLINYYEERTNAHIERVRRCLKLMAAATEHHDELLARAEAHDASKFGPEEYLPYIWLTEFYRCRRAGEPFEYPAGVKDKVRKAITHHQTTNRHHPEFHANPNDMTDVDIIEMVCDWTAMELEYGDPSGSSRAWANKTIGKRLIFNQERRDFTYAMINLMDRQLKAEVAMAS